MSEYTAVVSWNRAGESFLDRRYSRRHSWTFDGGIEVPASSSPHVVPTPHSDAQAVDPEEAFVAALSSCHMLWFLDFAARSHWVVDHYQDEAAGRMGRDAQGKVVMLKVCLRPKVRFGEGSAPTRDEVERLHHQAHEACYLASSVRSEVVCEPRYP